MDCWLHINKIYKLLICLLLYKYSEGGGGGKETIENYVIFSSKELFSIYYFLSEYHFYSHIPKAHLSGVI